MQDNSKLYNSDQKERYLANCKYENTTRNLIKFIYTASAIEEFKYDKDVCEFNQIEVTDLLKSFNSKSPHRLKSNCVYLNDYYLWCYNEGLVDSIINPFDKIVTDIIIENIIPSSTLAEKYLSKEEIINCKNEIIDVTNQFIFYALYLGIKGEEYEEIRNLKISDLDIHEHKVKLITGRIVNVDDLFINLMINANDELNYFPEGIEKESRANKYTYGSSEYVIKLCGVKYCDQVSYQYLSQRIRVAIKQINKKYISASTIYKNGLINFIKEKYEEQNIPLKAALFNEINNKLYVHDKETEQYIKEFGSGMTVRMLRMELREYIDQI